ncbi:hypothetical protein DICVIV_10193 [Dictyocaulus viviparus]|uniref:Ig-like domain-containing protein n=1 Tax=Dictyocaulus viviparus TaxID=29172 RepID=A0A0D8XN50_DICVI|nr:hypothetical protein DICVIV_10193 [Dictyocaulus viviparus]
MPPTIVSDSMRDVVALVGQDVDFTCKVDSLGRHMIAFVRSSTPPSLISFDEKESDRGNYSCQVNANPLLSATGKLDVKAVFDEF